MVHDVRRHHATGVAVTEVLLLLARKILSVKRHLAVTNVSSHWYLFTQWSMIKDLMKF